MAKLKVLYAYTSCHLQAFESIEDVTKREKQRYK